MFFLSWCYFEKHILRDKNINSFSIEPWMDIDPKKYPAFVIKKKNNKDSYKSSKYRLLSFVGIFGVLLMDLM